MKIEIDLSDLHGNTAAGEKLLSRLTAVLLSLPSSSLASLQAGAAERVIKVQNGILYLMHQQKVRKVLSCRLF
jgi:hypothetical protein